MANFTYNANREVILRGQAGVVEHLGRAEPQVTDREVWGWMTALSSPFDTITTPEGTFVMSAPARNPARRFILQPSPREFS